jgi:hypothetical protein
MNLVLQIFDLIVNNFKKLKLFFKKVIFIYKGKYLP